MGRRPFRRTRAALSAAGHALSQAAFWVAPQTVGKRLAWQRALDAQRRMLSSREAADTDRFRGAKWLTSRLSPDSEAEQDLEAIRKRSRDLYLNDPVAAGYVRGRVTNVVGTGIRPQARVRVNTSARITEEQARGLNKEIEAAWELWSAKASRCGRRPFWMIQRLAERCVAREGEALVVLSDKRVRGKPIPLCVEVVNIERLETPAELDGKTHANGRPKVRLGIEREPDSTPVAYYIRRADPDDTKTWTEAYDRVPADRVIHVYDDEDPAQSRGWPPMVPCMPGLKDVGDYDEAVLIKRQIEACFAVLIRNSGSPTEAAIAASTGTNSNSDRLEELVPGMIRYIGPSGEVETINPGPGTGEDHGKYLQSRYQRIAAGLNIPVEYLLRAFGGTNYSSGRLALLDVRADARVSQQFLIALLIVRVWERFVEECVLADLVNVSAAQYLAAPWVYTRMACIPPGQPWVDPLKEVMADEEAVEENFASRTEVVQGRGNDDEEVQDQRLREKMRDADNELALREYRESIGLPAVAPDKNASVRRPEDDADDADDKKSNGRLSRGGLIALANSPGD